MNKYVLTFKNTEGEIIYEYDSKGFLSTFNVKCEITAEQHKWLTQHMPFMEDEIAMFDKIENVNIYLIPQDLSFEAFWNTYGYKMGNKKRAIKLWAELNEGDRVEVFKHLPKYAIYLKQRSGMQKVYPETFLSQRRWENELPIN